MDGEIQVVLVILQFSPSRFPLSRQTLRKSPIVCITIGFFITASPQPCWRGMGISNQCDVTFSSLIWSAFLYSERLT